MLFEQIETPGLAHYAYLIGDGDEAAIVDPRRDVDEYLTLARRLGVRIRYVIETHRQEDFVMGAAHLAERSGAEIVNGNHDLFGHGDIRLADGDILELGTLRLKALHTPGHTPESMSYAIFAEQGADTACGVLTGDALFFGDTGRTDLTDPNRTTENAALLYDVIHDKLLPLGDGALVLPAHGAGSVCGSNMAPLPLSTIGAERQYNPVFTLSRSQFVHKKRSEHIPRPPYFRHMEEVNLRGGLPPCAHPNEVALLDARAFAECSSGQLVIDTREPEGYAGGHISDAYSIWLGGLPVFGGWVAAAQTPIYLVADRNDDVATAFLHLSRIGIDGVQGALAGGFGTWRSSGHRIATSGVITPRQLAEQRERYQVLDVRDADEVATGRIPGARHSYVGHLEDELRGLDLERTRPVAVTCSVGHRAGLGVSILRRAGFREVYNLLGGMKAWNTLDLPTQRAG